MFRVCLLKHFETLPTLSRVCLKVASSEFAHANLVGCSVQSRSLTDGVCAGYLSMCIAERLVGMPCSTPARAHCLTCTVLSRRQY